jgi:hypothetical protein
MAEGAQDAILAFRAYKEMHEASDFPGTFSPVKTLTHILRFIQGPDSVVFLAFDGEDAIGVLTLTKGSFWFSEDGMCLEDKGLFVRAKHRGEAGKLLLEAARDLSNDTGLIVFITIINGRRKRGGRSEWERIGATLGYSNLGATMAHFPET